jgi:hypothetical protein
MNLAKIIPDEILREALFLSMEDDDLERRLCRLEEMLEEMKEDDDEENV